MMPAIPAPATTATMMVPGWSSTVRLWISGWRTLPSKAWTATTMPSAHSAVPSPPSARATSTATAPERKAPTNGM